LTNPIFSEDFSWAVADDGIYSYDSTSKNYISSVISTFKANKKVWVKGSAFLVLSWANSSTTNVQDYELKVYSFSGTTLTEITTAAVTGTSYKTAEPKGPEISFSPDFDVVVLYGKSDATTSFFKGKKINYSANTSSDLTFPTAITETPSYFTVSSRYVYAHNTEDNLETTDKYNSAYYIDGSNLVFYFNTTLTTDEKTDLSRSFLLDENTDPKSIFLYR